MHWSNDLHARCRSLSQRNPSSVVASARRWSRSRHRHASRILDSFSERNLSTVVSGDEADSLGDDEERWEAAGEDVAFSPSALSTSGRGYKPESMLPESPPGWIFCKRRCATKTSWRACLGLRLGRDNLGLKRRSAAFRQRVADAMVFSSFGGLVLVIGNQSLWNERGTRSSRVADDI